MGLAGRRKIETLVGSGVGGRNQNFKAEGRRRGA